MTRSSRQKTMKGNISASQWLSGREFPLPMQATWVQSGSGTISHTTGQVAQAPPLLSLCSKFRTGNYRAHTPQRLKPPPRSLCPTMREACLLQLESRPHSIQLKKRPHSKKDPAQKKILYKIINIKLS